MGTMYVQKLFDSKKRIRIFRSYCSFFHFITAETSWGKVIFSQASVILFTKGGCYPSMHCRWYPSMPCSRAGGIPACLAAGWGGGIPACLADFQAHTQGGSLRGSDPGPQSRRKLRGIWSRPTPKGEVEGDLAKGGGGACSGGVCSGGGLRSPRDGCCCGQYASYWNAFLFSIDFTLPIFVLLFRPTVV